MQYTYTLPAAKLQVGDTFTSDQTTITEIWVDPEGVWVVTDDYADCGYLVGTHYKITREYPDS